MLTCRDYKVLQRGDVNTFVVRLEKDINEIVAIRLWHDNSGSDPSWLDCDERYYNFRISCVGITFYDCLFVYSHCTLED